MCRYLPRFFLNLFFIIIACPFLVGQSLNTVPLKWVNFNPYTKVGQNPGQNNSISDAHIICLLDTLKPWVEGIRTFGTQNGLQNIPALAKERGLKVIVGIWLGKENSPAGIAANKQQIANGIEIANAGYADKIIVGSEVLFRKDLPPSKLIEYIEEVQIAIPDVPVSCADFFSDLIANPRVVDACDFVSPNIYPFWDGSPIECAMQNFNESYLSLLPVAKGKEIFISESGWKTKGNTVDSALPSFVNAVQYIRELLSWSQVFGVDVNIFSAFDEPWKLPDDDGWGIFFSNKIMKPGMDALFTPIENIDSPWLCHVLNNSNADTLTIDFMPAIGGNTNLEGSVDYLVPCNYKIATYIKVGPGWWTKPSFNNPTVPIQCNGKWIVDFTTGGNDKLATDICVFIVPLNYEPPQCSNCPALPIEIYQNAISSECTQRYLLNSAALEVPSTSICKGDSLILTALGGSKYLWNTGERTPSIQIAPSQSTTYLVEISDGLGGGAILTQTINVLGLNLQANITTNPSTICLGESSDIVVTDGYSYLWNTGETTSEILVSPLTDALYTVIITDAFNCSISKQTTVEVNNPFLSLSINPGTILLEETATITTNSDIGSSFLWNTGEITNIIEVSPSNTTTYSVTITDMNNCTKEDSITLLVDTSTPTDGYPTSLNIKSYPNPIKDVLSLEMEINETGLFEFSIINSLGQTVLAHEKEKVTSERFVFKLDLSFLPTGVYYLRLKMRDRKYWIKKVIKIGVQEG